MNALPDDFYSQRLQAPARDYTKFAQFIARWRSEGGVLLDVGVGSGDVLRTIAAAVNFRRIVTLDRNITLLRAASQFETVAADFDVGLPLRAASADAVILSFVLHLSAHRQKLIAEVRRAMTVGGDVFILTVSERQLSDRLLNRFFPSLLRIDTARYPFVTTLQAELEAAAMTVRAVETLQLGEILLDEAFVDGLEHAAWSSFALLQEEERRDGLERLRTYLREQPPHELPLRTRWTRTAVVARAV